MNEAGGTHAPPSITVVIAARDAERTIGRTLDSLAAQTTSDFTVVVVDDGSDDATSAQASSHALRPLVVPSSAVGVAGARNKGAAAAGSELLTFLDADDEAMPDWLAAFRSALEEADVGVALLGHRVAGVSDEAVAAAGTDEGLSSGFLAGTYCVRTVLFREVGGFDEALRYSENTDLAWRLEDALREQGQRFVRSPDRLLLVHRASVAQRQRRYAAHRIAAVRLLREKHRARLRRHPDVAFSMVLVAAREALYLGRPWDVLLWTLRAVREHPRQAILWSARRCSPFRRPVRLSGGQRQYGSGRGDGYPQALDGCRPRAAVNAEGDAQQSAL